MPTKNNSNYVQNKEGYYYKHINGNKIKRITKKEYFSKISNNPKNLNRLKKSLYPTQGRDYILLKYPKTFPTDIRNKYVPADYEIANIIKALWKQKIITLGWDAGFSNKKHDYPGFITMAHRTTDMKDVIPILKKLFGPRRIKIFDYIMKPDEKPKPGKNTRNRNDKDAKKYAKLIRIKIISNFVSIGFNNSLIPWMSKKLKIKIPKVENSLPGSRIIHTPFYKIVK